MSLSLLIFRGHSTRELASVVSDDEQGGLFYFAAHTRTGVGHIQHRKKNRERFGKNGDEWTRGVKISKKEVPGSSRRMHVYTLTCSRLKRE